jgi:hypothetical protein
MRERIDIPEALRLYHTWRNWRDVALRLPRKTRTPFAGDAVQAAVRRHDRQILETAPAGCRTPSKGELK